MGEQRFRVALAQTHLTLAKGLWAADEGHGRAYELGNFLSDTWNRLRRRAGQTPQAALTDLFSADRVQQIKVLLDNLQTRLDPAAVHVVTTHLAAWRDRIATQSPGTADAPVQSREEVAQRFEPVERQMIIWRQMLNGDKEPESYIDQARRAEVRDELTRQLWRRYRRYWYLVPIVAVLGALIGYVLAHEHSAAGSVIGAVTAIAGILGITRASMLATAKRGLQDWGELMWNRSLAAVICRETLVLHELLPPPAAPPRTRRPHARHAPTAAIAEPGSA